MIKNTNNSPSLFSSLSDMLDQSHPLYRLADKIDWGKFETAFQPLYCQDNGRPGKPIRLMCGLLILKHLRNLSDESLVEQWSENAYYQYFCGMKDFTPSVPCASSELVHFRKRIGEAGIELIFRKAFVWITRTMMTTIMIRPLLILRFRKRISLTPRMRSCIRRSWRKFLALWKAWSSPASKLHLCAEGDLSWPTFPESSQEQAKALKADRRLRTIAGRLVRELKRNLKENHDYDKQIDLFETVLSQRRNSRKKFIPFMSRKCNVSARAKNIRNTNSATRYPSYVLSQALFLEPCPFAMNMTGIPSSLPWNR